MNLTDSVRREFQSRYQRSPEILVKSPGRVNIIGEHTDYNGGLVMPCAIDKYIVIAAQPNRVQKLRVYAADLNEYVETSLVDLTLLEKGHFANFLLGVYAATQRKAQFDLGLDLIVKGNIPLGAGLSSSAALTCAMAYTLNVMANLNLNASSLAKIVQEAHHSFVGVKCGMLDQMASLLGKRDRVMLIDCKDLNYEYLPLVREGIEWALIDTHVKHAHVSSAYNDRVESCQRVLKTAKGYFPALEVLSDLRMEQLLDLKAELSKDDFHKARFVLSENARVLSMKKALMNNDFSSAGRILYESHDGLSKEYEVSCDELDFIVRQCRQDHNILGARMMGGGFGGCVLLCAQSGYGEKLFHKIKDEYADKFNRNCSLIHFESSDGTSLEGDFTI